MKIKNLFKWIGTILEIILVIATVVIQYFSDKKMGMIRHFSYQNYKWNEINLRIYIIYALVILLLLLIVSVIINRKKSAMFMKSHKLKWFVVYTILDFIAIVFAVTSNTDSISTYYVFGLVAVFILVIEVVKLNFLCVKK